MSTSTAPPSGPPGASDPDRDARRRIVFGLFLAHALGSAGVIATTTISSIIGAELSGRTALAGLPAAAAQIGGAVAAVATGWATERLGRRVGLGAVTAFGAAGMVAAAAAAMTGAFPLLLFGLVLSGGASATSKFARFTAAEISPRLRRGRAVATVVMGGTVGSVLGPLLVAPSGAAALSAGLPELAGPYLATVLLFLGAVTAFFVYLRPEPRELAERIDADERAASLDTNPDLTAVRPWRERLRDPGIATAMAVLVLAQGVMVLLMALTSLHMHVHAHGLGAISAVFAGHTLGMYALSMVSGAATDRFGRVPMAVVGGLILLLACLLAPLSPTFVPLFAALFLLGFGWNLCYVAGSAWLTDRLRTAEKSATQGVNDLAMGAVSAGASMLGGVLFAMIGYGAMAGLGAVAAALLVLLAVRRLPTTGAPRYDAGPGGTP